VRRWTRTLLCTPNAHVRPLPNRCITRIDAPGRTPDACSRVLSELPGWKYVVEHRFSKLQSEYMRMEEAVSTVRTPRTTMRALTRLHYC
jgi:hypothetical protein